MRAYTKINLVVINTLVTYMRMFLCAGLSLFSSRWILSALGQTDFGLYAVVAGIMGFLSFLTGAMTGSAQRHFAYALGQNDSVAVNNWFNASLRLHLGLAIVMVFVGLPFGRVMIYHVLTIPQARLEVCYAVFMCTLVTILFNVLSVPFAGMYTAKQRISELSLYQFAQTAVMFLFAYGLNHVQSDRLLAYAIGVMAISLLTIAAQVARCLISFKECRLSRCPYDQLMSRMLELVSFAGWNLFGALGHVASNQGMAFLINVFSGPSVNSSFGIANQVSGQVSSLSQGMFNALSPEITASEGRGNRERVIELALRASKFSLLLVCIFLIPVLAELDMILVLWLKNVPPYAASLCRVALVAFLIDKMTIGYMVAVAAHGKIVGYQATLGGALLFAPLIAWLIFAIWGDVVWAIGSGLLITRTVCSLGRVWWVRKLMNIPAHRWLLAVPARCAAATAIPIFLAALIHWSIKPSMMRLAAIFGTSIMSLCVMGWVLGLDRKEREYFINVCNKGVQFLRLAFA